MGIKGAQGPGYRLAENIITVKKSQIKKVKKAKPSDWNPQISIQTPYETKKSHIKPKQASTN